MDKKEYLERMKTSHGLNMKALRKFVDENQHLPDDMAVLCERVTDIHFKSENGRTGWDTYKVEGFSYQMAIKKNEDIEKGEYPETVKPWTDEQLELWKEDFFHSWCITTDNNVVLIYNHY